MDYFSELLESYTKLKKRTFKLTYINEQEDPNEATSKALGSAEGATAAEPYMIPGSQGALWQSRTGAQEGRWTFTKDLAAYKANQKGGRSMPVLNDPNDPGFSELRSFLGGGGGGKDSGVDSGKKEETEDSEADAAEKQAELEAQAAEKAPFHFEKAGYSTDKNDPENISQGIAAVERTMIGLNQYCDGFENPDKAPIICSPQQKTRLISSEGNASFSYKLANAEVVSQDGAMEQAPPGLLNDVSENHDEFMSFLYSPPSDPKELEQKCNSLNSKVGFHNGNIIVFGNDKDSDGKPTAGLTFSTKDNKLYDEVLNSVRNSCGNNWKPERTFTQTVANPKALNTIRGSINEKALVLAITLDDPNATPEQKREAVRNLALYAKEKEEYLRDYTKGLYEGQEDKTKDLNSYYEAQVLAEEAQLAEAEGAPGVLRYLLESVQQTRGFVQELGANGAYDNSKGGGQGDRADTVATFNTQADAEAAAERLGLDPKAAVRVGRPGTPGEGLFEIGIGQKLKAGEIDGFKMGEYNTNQRRRDAIRGDLTNDPKFDRRFYKWADERQFGGPVDQGEAKERFDRMVDFEDSLESSIQSIETSMTSGRVFVGPDGKIKSQSGEQTCGAVAKQFTQAMGYQDGNQIGPEAPREAQEFHDVFFGKTDWSDVAEREKGTEAVSRKARMKTVQQAVEDPEAYLEARGDLEGLSPEERQIKVDQTRQAGQDWVVRNMLLTGGNATDITQLQTSTKTGESLATDHNAVLNMITENPDKVEYSFDGFGVKATIDGLSVNLSFERTDATKGSGRAKETRAVCSQDKQTTKDPRVSQEFKPDRKRRGKPQEESTFHSFIRRQAQLFEEFLNSSK